jgi:hypothetical protein
MLTALCAAVLTIGYGWLIPQLVCRRSELPRSMAIRVLIGMGLALGLPSLIYFWTWYLPGPVRTTTLVVELVLILSLAVLLKARAPGRSRTDDLAPPSTTGPKPGSRVRLIVLGAHGFVLLHAGLALLQLVGAVLRDPHGHWDGWAIWNMKARFLFRDQAHWLNVFSDLYDWFHPDYPLLAPGTIGRAWMYLNGETLWVPQLLALSFAVGTFWLLYSGLSKLVSPGQGIMAALLMLAHSDAVLHGASQYADTPLGFYFLLSLFLFAVHDRQPQSHRDPGLLTLAGLTAGLAAWTKNEGFLFVLCVLSARSLGAVVRRDWTRFKNEIMRFGLGLSPVLLTLLLFKGVIAPRGDLLVQQQGTPLLVKLLDPARYSLTLVSFAEQYLAIGPGVVLVLVALALLFGLAPGRWRAREGQFLLLVLGFMHVGYLMVYVLTPQDLEWHLRSSVDRLLIQLWPSVILVWALLTRPPEALLHDAFKGSQESPAASR